MKKIFSILFASVIALMAVSCYPEDLAVFDTSKAKAPVLGDYEVGAKAVTASFTAGSFNQNFNKNVTPNHFFVITNVDNKVVSKAVTTSNKEGVLSASITSINNALVAMGYAEGDVVSLTMRIRASMQTNAGDNGRNGFVDSDGTIDIPSFEIVFPKGSPYQDYTATSEWSVIGSISAYEMSWDKDLEMWATEDGLMHVAKCVSLKAGEEFKFRKNQSWDVNYGGTFGSLDTPFTVNQGGDNIVAPADGLYDLWLDVASESAWLSEAYQPYPDHKEASNWSVIGSLSEYGMSWDGDLPMLTDGTTHVAQGIKIASADEFKFRQDKSWDVNLGGPFGGLGSDFAVTQGGDNIVIGAAGVYDLIVNPGAGTAQIVETMGGGVSGIIGGDEPGPEPVVVKGWNLIGVNGAWGDGEDIIAAELDGVWTAYFRTEEGTEFKWRLDGAWTSNYGGTMAALGEPFAAVPDAGNIAVGPGFWKVVLNLKDEANPTITVSEGVVWSLIGGFNSWGGDVDMVQGSDGVWTSPETKISGEFKLRYNHDWADNRGGTLVAFGEPFAVELNGSNIDVAEGTYVVSYNPATEQVTVTNAKKVWGVIGVNGDWNNDVVMEEVMPGIWMSPKIEVTSPGWKVRFDHGWDINRGGATKTELEKVGQFAAAVPNGEDLALTGTFKVVYNANNGTIGTLGWGVVGTINGWNGDVPMNLASDGKWYSIPVALTTADEVKIRWDADWADNRGGNMAAVGEPFAVEGNGANIKVPADGTYMLVYDPAAEQMTVTKAYWGMVGAFNEWGSQPDVFLLFNGKAWVAYGQTVSGDWKLREGSDWGNNRGGVFATGGTPFTAEPNGSNINLGDMTNYSVVYDPTAETITIQ